MERPEFKDEDISYCITEVSEMLKFRLSQKDRGIYISAHEALGIVTEEFHEYVRTVEHNDSQAQYDELMDIAVACLAGMASIRGGKMHW